MGSVSLIAVAHDEADLPKLRMGVAMRARMMARQKMHEDPVLARKVLRMLAD